MAIIGAVVSVAIILMKIVPGVPGSFTRAEIVPVLTAEVDKNVRKAGQFKETLALALTYQLF